MKIPDFLIIRVIISADANFTIAMQRARKDIMTYMYIGKLNKLINNYYCKICSLHALVSIDVTNLIIA